MVGNFTKSLNDNIKIQTQIMIIILLIFFALFFYLLYVLIKWISKKKTRIQWTFGIIGIVILINIIDSIFFTKMEFIQSKVYPHLYLVKNQINNQYSLNAVIKNMVVQKMNATVTAVAFILIYHHKSLTSEFAVR